MKLKYYEIEIWWPEKGEETQKKNDVNDQNSGVLRV
jgi:hypothetical protein